MYQFQKAKAVWMRTEGQEYNQFAGFHCRFNCDRKEKVRIAIAARTYYRLYLNGEMAASGPARTAKGYARVDELIFEADGGADVAIEVAAYAKPGGYSNDCTLEPGMLTAELTAEDGRVLAATGENIRLFTATREGVWRVRRLTTRRAIVETMSHSRGIVEYYDREPGDDAWLWGEADDWRIPVLTDNLVIYLKRRSPYPTYQRIPLEQMMGICDMVPSENGTGGFVLGLARMFNREWYEMIPEENCFLEGLRKEKDAVFTGRLKREAEILSVKRSGNDANVRGVRLPAGEMRTDTSGYVVTPGENPVAVTFGSDRSELGFLEITVGVEQECVLDVINSDHLYTDGSLRSNSYVTRYVLAPGDYHLITFEPKLTRYVRLIFRTTGVVRFLQPQLLDDTYPYDGVCGFSCNDGDLNRIYEAARRTLRLNTLDIFMDCPQRERGGWLCDSQFTSMGAWQMFGDLSVEKDFIENFMLTDPDEMWHAFFPEVYPGSKGKSGDPGITNWSFWLLTELSDYYDRSGDRKFIEWCRGRVERFVEGMFSLRGESGLLENMGGQFVDWSLSNRSFCLGPISIPNNCLAVRLLEKMAAIYDQPDWREAADQMRQVIEEMDAAPGGFGRSGDSASYENGRLLRGECLTESGAALEIWSGFHLDDKNYMRRFVDTMGVAPRYRADPNVGKSNLFIGLMIRFDVLARLGKIDTLVREWKELYLPELRDGSGTLFENYAAFSGCHGFNAATGALMTSEVLGLGAPMQRTKTVRIAPHPGELKWASGSERCDDGLIFLRWSADDEAHVLDMQLVLPQGWSYELALPFELSGWTVRLNGENC